jgi:hypothetical protein
MGLDPLDVALAPFRIHPPLLGKTVAILERTPTISLPEQVQVFQGWQAAEQGA